MWENTDESLDWFKGRREEPIQWSFIQLDVVSMYPSINKDLLEAAITWAKTNPGVKMSKEEEQLVWINRQSLLFAESDQWEKSINSDFDVGIGSRDGAECCEIVDLFLLHQLTEVENLLPRSNVGTFRDDFLGCTGRNKSDNERLKKKIIALFRRWGLKIEISMDQTKVDYLDVCMDFTDGSFRPYMKPNSKLKYVNKESDHWKLVLDQIPKGIEKRLNKLSSSKDIFDNAKPLYEEALKNSGYPGTLQWKDDQERGENRRMRKKLVTWFNPPFSRSIKTNVGK